jgi:hypothetical protein
VAVRLIAQIALQVRHINRQTLWACVHWNRYKTKLQWPLAPLATAATATATTTTATAAAAALAALAVVAVVAQIIKQSRMQPAAL